MTPRRQPVSRIASRTAGTVGDRSLAAGSLLFPGILSQLLTQDVGAITVGPGAAAENPLAPRQPHFPAKAKRVIFLYMSGGVSHMDTFDPKPRLTADAGKPSGTGKPQDENNLNSPP